jgi:phosphoglycerate kinase
VLIREDLNVPVKDGKVTSDARIRASLPTIEHAMKAGAKVMLMSHLGRPEEGVFREENSLKPVADHLSGLLGREVRLVKDYLDGVDVADGEVVMLENVRFNKGEKKNDEALSKQVRCPVRRVRDGCLRHRAPRPGLHPWRGAVRPRGLRRPAAGRGA